MADNQRFWLQVYVTYINKEPEHHVADTVIYRDITVLTTSWVWMMFMIKLT